ncbi:MAG: MTH938/NDUFAF3 family protein [Candidatus Dormibacteria bacterium]
MRFESFSFGSIRIDGVTYGYDLVIDRGEIRKRKKRASKEYRAAYGHTPLSIKEDIPWHCRRLVVGTGARGALPVMDEVLQEAKRRKVELLSVPTEEAITTLNVGAKDTNAILHLTC